MTEEAQCIFDKTELIKKIEGIIGGLKGANAAAESANTKLTSEIDILQKEKSELQVKIKTLKVDNSTLTTDNENINNQLEVLRGEQGGKEKYLLKQLDELREDNTELTENKNKRELEIKKLETDLEAQKKTSNENMEKIISTLVSERNRLLEESEESKKNQEEKGKLAKALADAKAQAQADADTKAQADAKAELEKALQAALAELKKTQAALAKEKAKVQAALQAKEAELQTALTKCNQEKEELKQAAQSKTESMNNIEKIQNFTNLSRTDIQTKLWETANEYMESQFNDQNYQTTITSDPFVQVELKTLLNDDTEVTQDVTSAKIKEAHNKVIERHYKTIYPSSNIETVPQFPDHIVIPPYLYLSLTHFYTIFSFLNTRQFYMRFLDQGQELPLEPGFHIIIKKLGDGDQDFFSRVDVKFVLLETETTAKDIIDKIFKESTFYGHIPTQTILQDVSIRGGNKTLKNNKRRLKKRRKYTQSNRRK